MADTHDEHHLLIGGKWVDAGGGTYDIVNPATEEVVGQAPNASVADAEAAPSVDAQNGFKALLPMVDAELNSWDKLKSRDLVALNAKLKAAGKEPIDVK